MKKFTSTALGGAPVDDDDLLDIFNSEIWTAIQALLSPFDSDTQGIVVSGCVTTNNSGNFDMTAGIVYLNGEFMRVGAVTNQAFTKYIAPSTPVNDTRTYGDGTMNVTAVTKGAGLVGSAPVSGQYLSIASLTDLDDRRLSTITVKGTTTPIAWTNISLINGWLATSGQTPQYSMDAFGHVFLRGSLNGSGASSDTFANIPVGISHATERDVCTLRFNGTAFEVIGFSATTGGVWRSFSSSNNTQYFLDGINYWP